MLVGCYNALLSFTLLMLICPVGTVPDAGPNQVKGQILSVNRSRDAQILSQTRVEVEETSLSCTVDAEGKFYLSEIPGPDLKLIFHYGNGENAYFLKENIGYGRVVEMSNLTIEGQHVKGKVIHYATARSVNAWLEKHAY